MEQSTTPQTAIQATVTAVPAAAVITVSAYITAQMLSEIAILKISLARSLAVDNSRSRDQWVRFSSPSLVPNQLAAIAAAAERVWISNFSKMDFR